MTAASPVLSGISIATASAKEEPPSEIAEELQYWIGRASELPPQTRAAYEQQVRGYAIEALSQLSKMGLSGGKLELQSIVQQFRASALSFFESNQDYEKNKGATERKFQDMKLTILNAGKHLNFSDFKPEPAKPFSPKEFLANDLMWGHKWMNVQENMALARMVGASIEAIGAGIQMACEDKPKVGLNIPNPVCLTFQGMAAAAHWVAQLPGFKQVVEAAHSENIPLQQELQAQYGIPREQAQQYSLDAFTKVAPLMIPAGGVGAVGRAASVFRGARTVAQTEGALVPPWTSMAPMQPVFNQIFALLNSKPGQVVGITLVDSENVIQKFLPKASAETMPLLARLKKAQPQLLRSPEEAITSMSKVVYEAEHGDRVLRKEMFRSPSEMASTLVTYHFFESLNAKYLKSPWPLAAYQAEELGSQVHYLVSSSMRGDSIAKLLEGVAKLAADPLKQEIALKELGPVCQLTGKMTADIHNKGKSADLLPHSDTLTLPLIKRSMEAAEHVEASFKIPMKKWIEESGLYPQFIKDPGPRVHGFRQVLADNFIYSPAEPGALGYLFGEGGAFTFNAAREPFALAAEEYAKFHWMFKGSAMELGLTREQAFFIQDQYHKGYVSVYTGQHSSSAVKFLAVHAKMGELLGYAELYKNFGKMNPMQQKLLTELIQTEIGNLKMLIDQ